MEGTLLKGVRRPRGSRSERDLECKEGKKQKSREDGERAPDGRTSSPKEATEIVSSKIERCR